MTHTEKELRQLQELPLNEKIRMTRMRIQQWVSAYGINGVHISFSGGKDSTVLLDIARRDYPNIQAVFFDTGLEYPEIREFVKSYDNVVWLKPKMNFRQVIEKYGYPFISKEVAENVAQSRNGLRKKGEDYQSTRLQRLRGEFTDKNGNKSKLNQKKWEFLLNAPFSISATCCDVMKKRPAHEYEKKTGRHPITAQMASESRLRYSNYLRNGCNAFDAKHPISNPMAFWTDQDVLLYIKLNNLPIASVYGEVVVDYDELNQLPGQISLNDLMNEPGAADEPILRTTGCSRTGCMFCGFGCHLEKETRFVRLKETHPKQYDFIMRPSGLNYKEVIDWLNENGNLNIKY